MIGFILSKMNLLILVTAIFAIVSYFSFWLGDSIVSQQAQQIINRFARDSETIIYAPNQCNVTSVTIPSSINYFGNFDNGGRLFYLLDVSKLENVSETAGEQQLNHLLVSIKDKKSQNVIAAKTFGTIAKIRLFSWNPKTNLIEEVDTNTTLNPQSAPLPTNSIYLIKEVFEGKQYFYILPCGQSNQSSSLICESNLQTLGDKIAEERNGVSFCINKTNPTS